MENLKTFEEYTDYRNVTGFGSMGQPGDQNAGPSFNKGPNSATYNRPDVIGVEQINMEDPYFGEKREKSRKAKKNRYITKLRRRKAKDLKKIEDKAQKEKMVDDNI